MRWGGGGGGGIITQAGTSIHFFNQLTPDITSIHETATLTGLYEAINRSLLYFLSFGSQTPFMWRGPLVEEKIVDKHHHYGPVNHPNNYSLISYIKNHKFPLFPPPSPVPEQLEPIGLLTRSDTCIHAPSLFLHISSKCQRD